MSLTGCTVEIKDTPSDADSQKEIHTVLTNDNNVTDTSDPYMIVDENVPGFTEDEITTESFEHYSELDALGRCGVATACVGTDLMPTQKRGNISRVKPTGWHSIQYDFIDGKSLYNRCHLIAHQLAGEDANEKNLITGTRYMNVSGMLPFEEEVGDYVRETGNHVMYRVTPVFEGDNLVADGVQMEALSVEDGGEGVSYNVYVFNAQPGIRIDYATGESEAIQTDDMVDPAEASNYILNVNTKKFHLPSCSSAEKIQKENKENFTGDREQLVRNGYEPCGSCNP
ncbi:MAG: DNA/RNA non-specific endonuclease [Eubacterium sp.]|nr:DNA/RNA non-specific endonuclease [Eubacterium sp.]